jgi:hypothetical protein
MGQKDGRHGLHITIASYLWILKQQNIVSILLSCVIISAVHHIIDKAVKLLTLGVTLLRAVLTL